MAEPRVSVVVVNYNAGVYLERCVRSVLGSDCALELIVIDNGSADGSIETLRRSVGADARVKIVVNPRNLGFASAVNIGAGLARAPMLALLNPDCLVRPHTYARVLDALEAQPDVGIAGALVFNPDGSEQRGCRRREPTPRASAVKLAGLGRRASTPRALRGVDLTAEPLPAEPVRVDAVSGAFLVVRRDVFAQIGRMDEGYFLHCEDLDLCRRCREHGHGVLFVPGASVVHHQGVSGRERPLSVEWHKHRGMARYYAKFYRSEHRPAMRAAVTAAIYAHLVLRMGRGVLNTLAPRRRAALAVAEGARAPAMDAVAPERSVFVVGSGSIVGRPLVARLVAERYHVIGVGRPRAADEDGVTRVSREYFTKVPAADFSSARVLIHLAPIWMLSDVLDAARRHGVTRVIALSSSSILTKADTDDAGERNVVEALARGEQALWQACREHGLEGTLFRPTLIYDGCRDRNVTRIRNFVRRFRVFPLLGAGSGLRQPVHADDIAAACARVIDEPRTFGKVYALGGGRTLTYREMVSDIFADLGLEPRFVNVPPQLLRGVLRVLSWLPTGRDLTPAMAERMNRDLCFGNEPAQVDFDYRPQPFTGAACGA